MHAGQQLAAVVVDETNVRQINQERDFARRAVAVPRLSGFCLLARRDVLDKIGGFDFHIVDPKKRSWPVGIDASVGQNVRGRIEEQAVASPGSGS